MMFVGKIASIAISKGGYDNMRICMPRGDIRLVRFQVIDDDGDISDIDFDEIYFTVKKHYSDTNFLFQKRLSTGDIIKINTGDYQIRIEPQDTDNLIINRVGESYDFDIELRYEDQIKQTFAGEFVLTKEVTHAVNEGS